MCESLWFPNSVSLSCSTFTIRGCLTVNKYNTSGEIINTICLNLLVSSRFGKHYRSWTCLRIYLCSHQFQICFTQAMIIISDTVSKHRPLPQSYKGHVAHNTWAWQGMTSIGGGHSSLRIQVRNLSAEVCVGGSDDMTGQWDTVGLSRLLSAILSETDGKCCP